MTIVTKRTPKWCMAFVIGKMFVLDIEGFEDFVRLKYDGTLYAEPNLYWSCLPSEVHFNDMREYWHGGYAHLDKAFQAMQKVARGFKLVQ